MIDSCVCKNNKKNQLKSYCKQLSQLNKDVLYDNHVLKDIINNYLQRKIETHQK